MITVGFDTSNYTTSIAAFDGNRVINVSQLLKVRPGELGLRQSDALFAHVKALPALSEQLFAQCTDGNIDAVGVSTRPRAVEGSYMPCFLAGVSCASTLAGGLHVPLREFSHQQGHFAAVLYSAQKLDLLRQPFLCWHISGGTTELLLVNENQADLQCRIIGGTKDISVGQVIDRAGKMLGLPFPSGKALSALSDSGPSKDLFSVKKDGYYFSLSGLENKIRDYHVSHSDPETAKYVFNSICKILCKVSMDAIHDYGGLPLVFSGGVSSNRQLRLAVSNLNPVFGEPQFSTDNAGGIAVLAWMEQNG